MNDTVVFMSNSTMNKRDATAARIIRDIESGVFAAGSKLPFLTVLAERYEVSTGTTSNALYDVLRAGYLAEKAGTAAPWHVAAASVATMAIPDALTRLKELLGESLAIIDQVLPTARKSIAP